MGSVQVWETRALPSILSTDFFFFLKHGIFQSISSFLYVVWLEVSLFFFTIFRFLDSVHLPSLAASHAILLNVSMCLRTSAWFYLEVPNFSFLLESFSSPNTFFPNVPSSSTFLFISLVLMSVHLAKYNLLVLFLHRTSAGSFHLAVSYISISNVCFLIF